MAWSTKPEGTAHVASGAKASGLAAGGQQGPVPPIGVTDYSGLMMDYFVQRRVVLRPVSTHVVLGVPCVPGAQILGPEEVDETGKAFASQMQIT